MDETYKKYLIEDKSKEWIGVDLDGTLAQYDEYIENHIGEVIPEMQDRVMGWLGEGRKVKIVSQ